MNEINNNKVNLCDSCSQVYPDCTSKPENVYFGDGIGHDNICACSEYQPKSSELKRDLSDTISRQAAISFVDCGYLRPPTELAWSDKDVVDMLKRLPSAQPQDIARDIATIIENEKDMRVMLQQRWIPVTERLPEEDTEVIVSCIDDSGDSEFSYTTTGWHYKGIWVVDNERSFFVRAWMSLPEPWKGEQDE